MRTLARTLTLILIFPLLAAGAPPHRHWYTDWKNWALIAASLAPAGYATHEIHDCRMRNDLQHCPDGGYGPFRGRESIRWSLSLGMAAMSVYGREHFHGALLNDAPVAIWGGYNLGVGIADHRVPTYGRDAASRLVLTVPPARPR